jgi:8-hydroxy-5-deazaflavin:NADPH oxidoreductase
VKPKVPVIGKGNVGSALGRGLVRASYEVRWVGNDPPCVRETAAWVRS